MRKDRLGGEVALKDGLCSIIITEREFLDLMQKHFILYTHFRFKWGTPYSRYSLVEAGSPKSTYNAAVYDGGWTACFALDVLIRQATAKAKGLEDAFHLLRSQCEADASGYTNREIMKACSQTAGIDLSSFFEEHIKGTKMIRINEIIKVAGFRGNTTIYGSHVDIEENSNSLQTQIRSAILGRAQVDRRP